MTGKTPIDFKSHDDWLAHVRNEIPISEQSHALAAGRMELFRRFSRMQGIPLPNHFAETLERIESLHDPEQTAALEALNDVLFRGLTKHLFHRARQIVSEDDSQRPAGPQEQIRELLGHLEQTNPYFALWVVYKKSAKDHTIGEEWDNYLVQELGAESVEEIEFAQAMAKLDKVLTLFHDRKQALPSLAFERIWFLHYLRGPERMAQTRAVLGMLTVEMAACTSA